MPRIIRRVIVARMEKGEYQRKVSCDLNICQSMVNSIWIRYRKFGTTHNQLEEVDSKKRLKKKEDILWTFIEGTIQLSQTVFG